jgi:hypothetical protein
MTAIAIECGVNPRFPRNRERRSVHDWFPQNRLFPVLRDCAMRGMTETSAQKLSRKRKT